MPLKTLYVLWPTVFVILKEAVLVFAVAEEMISKVVEFYFQVFFLTDE